MLSIGSAAVAAFVTLAGDTVVRHDCDADTPELDVTQSMMCRIR